MQLDPYRRPLENDALPLRGRYEASPSLTNSRHTAQLDKIPRAATMKQPP